MSAANLSDFPAITLDEWQQHSIEAEFEKLHDIAFADDVLVAVGKKGLFYTLQNETLTKIETPVSLDLNAIYCISPSEIFIAGEAGCVLFYDGKTVEQIGEPIKTISLLFDERRDDNRQNAPVNLLCITARSKNDIFVAGTPSVLLHFDGSQWQHIDVGQKEFLIPDQTVIGHHYAYSSFGPIWQTRGETFVVKGDPPNIVPFDLYSVVEKIGVPSNIFEFADVLLRPSVLSVARRRKTSGMMHGMGYPPKDTLDKLEYEYGYVHKNMAFPIESFNNTRILAVPQVQKAKDEYYIRFNNRIYHFDPIDLRSRQGGWEFGWELLCKLPDLSEDVKWSHWAMNQNGDILIQNFIKNYWMLNHQGTWYRIESMPELHKTWKITLNDKGHFAAILYTEIFTGKITLPKEKQCPASETLERTK